VRDKSAIPKRNFGGAILGRFLKAAFCLGPLLAAARADGAAPRPAAPVEENNAGVAALKQGRLEEAVAHLRSALRRDPSSPAIRRNLAAALDLEAHRADEAGRFLEAERTFVEALNLAPDEERIVRHFAAFLNNRAAAFLAKGRPDLAERYLERALSYLPRLKDAGLAATLKNNYSNVVAAKGCTFDLLQEPEKARACYRKALEYNPANAAALAGLADLEYEDDAYTTALALYEKALAAAPRSGGDAEFTAYLAQKIDTIQKEMTVEANFILINDHLGRFRLTFPRDMPKATVAHVLATLNEAYVKVGRDFDFYPKRPVMVKIYPRVQLARFKEIPPWVGGFFDGKVRLLVEEISGSTSRLRRSIFHEYTHAVIHRMAGRSVPSWLHEGLAQTEEPGRTLTRRDIHYLAIRVKTGEVAALGELSCPFRPNQSGERLPLIYLQSLSIVRYLLDHGGWPKIRLLLRETARAGDFDKALRSAYGMTPEELIAAWKKWLAALDSADRAAGGANGRPPAR